MSELRQIRTLRLGARRREQAARTAIALEDALRTASLPRLPRGAILLVRRLDLGRLPADASPQWLSRHVERRLQALQLTPVRPSPDGPAPPAVWFADRGEALAVLLAASLHAAPRAWYWAGVLPGWRPGMAMRELLPRVLRHALAEPHAAAGPAGVAALLDRLLRHGRLDPVLEHLEPGHVAPLAGSAGATVAAAAPIAAQAQTQATAESPHAQATSETSKLAKRPPPWRATETSAPPIASAAWSAVLSRWLRRWGAADRRSHWLAAHALVAVHGPAAAAHADRLIARVAAPAPLSRPDPLEAQAERTARRALETLSCTPEDARGPGRLDADDGRESPSEPGSTRDINTEPQDAPADPGPDVAPPAETDWQPSRHGGLLLLLPALARLGIAEADPEGDLCLRLLHRIADRLKIRKDPIRRALPQLLPREGPWGFVPPAAWRDLMRMPRGADLEREDCLLAVCQLVLARYLRRYAKISPRRLIRRPALVHATPTHIDLCFDARWAELEVRRAGLDLDPGWVPWLGRVVSFHYDYEGRL